MEGFQRSKWKFKDPSGRFSFCGGKLLHRQISFPPFLPSLSTPAFQPVAIVPLPLLIFSSTSTSNAMAMVGADDDPLLLPARPPRRKRFVAGSHIGGDYNGLNNGGGSSITTTTLADDDDTDPSSASGLSPSSISNRKGIPVRTKSGRTRDRISRRGKKSTLRFRWMGMHTIIVAAIFIFIITFCYHSIIGNSPNEITHDGTEHPPIDSIERILSELSNANSPFTTEVEQEILLASYDTINQFPISIGVDTDGNNPNWETIVHPATEALRYFNKGDPSIKKRMKPAELAKALSRNQQLRGNVGGGNYNNLHGNENQVVDEGLMRVPKFWDPTPYRIIADERERRQNGNTVDGSILNNATREGDGGDGVRRYLGSYGSRLMTPGEAKSIGSRIPLQNVSNNAMNNEEAELLETIFIAVASYRDWQCSRTVESAFQRASHPERIRVAVVDQIHIGIDTPCSVPPNGTCTVNPDQAACKYKSQIDYLTVDAELSVGPVFARHLGNRLYRGEYFAVQSDAHVEYTNGWDTEIIEQWHSAKNEMAVLSTYLSGVEDHIDVTTGNRISNSRPIMCESDFEGFGVNKHLRHGQQPEGTPYIHDMPTLHPFWAAGFSFGRGHFVVNVPYDQHLPWIFQGEEISIGLRGFS